MRAAFALTMALLVSHQYSAATVSAQPCDPDELYTLFSDGSYYADSFASDMDADDEWVVVGAPSDNEFGQSAGAAYVFDLQAGVLLHKLMPDDLEAGDRFGHSVEIENQIIAVSSIGDEHTSTRTGSVYLFEAQSGDLIRKIPVPEGFVYETSFGRGLALHENLLVVSAIRGRCCTRSQAAVVYLYDVDSGELIRSFVPEGASAFDSIHSAKVLLNQEQVVVGWSAQRFSSNDVIYRVVVHDIASGGFRYALMPPGSPDEDRITGSIAVDDQRIVLGNFRRNEDLTVSPEVHIFDADTGQHIQELVREDPVPYSSFGTGLALSGAYIALGVTPGNEISSGAVDLFSLDTLARVGRVLTADQQVGFDSFGANIRIVGDRLVVTGFGNDNDGTYSGSGAVFELACLDESICDADLDRNGELNYFDVALFLQQYQSDSPSADLNGDGLINFYDVAEFLKIYQQGCR